MEAGHLNVNIDWREYKKILDMPDPPRATCRSQLATLQAKAMEHAEICVTNTSETPSRDKKD